MLSRQVGAREVRELVVESIREIMPAEKAGEPIEDESLLNAHLGLSSLDLATLMAVMEEKLGVDPFAELVSITSVRTVGDTVDAYLRCFEVAEGAEPTELQKVAARAQRRSV